MLCDGFDKSEARHKEVRTGSVDLEAVRRAKLNKGWRGHRRYRHVSDRGPCDRPLHACRIPSRTLLLAIYALHSV